MQQRLKGREIVVVMGVGFVGAVMAGVVADSVNRETGKPRYFVIGMQRPSTRSFWKIPYLNRGIAPVEAEDPDVAPLIQRCVLDKQTLTATFTYDALSLADVVVVDVQCDYHKETLGNVRQGQADIAALEDSLKVIGEKIQPHCLVLIETTVPPGTTEYVAYPILKKAFESRGLLQPQTSNKPAEPLLAHSFERVMPGRHYVASIRDFWRVCSGINPPSRERVKEFLSNILFPGSGIGGYCLPKDGGLGVWAYHTLMGFEDDIFKITPMAIDINDTRALHVAQLVRDALRNMGRIVGASRIAVLGASYREDVGDTRYSGSELVVRKLVEMGAEVVVHDPYVRHW